MKNIICFLLIHSCIQAGQYATAQDNDIVFEHPYRLTRSMLHDHAALVQTLLNIHYTEAQAQKHVALAKAYWEKGDLQGMQAVLGNLQFYEEIKSKPQEEQKAFVRQIRSTLIINLIDDGRKAEDSRWYLENYLQAYPPLVKGDIPLIVETADDLIDFESFKNGTLKGQPTRALSQPERDKARAALAAAWKDIPSAKKREIMLGASRLAIIQYRWRSLSAFEKIDLKLRYVGRSYVSNTEYRQYQATLASNISHVRGEQWQLVQNELDFMKRSTDIIMSRGTRWNPAANRYEQEGGVVTEFW